MSKNETENEGATEANIREYFKSPLVKYTGIVSIAFSAGVLFAGVPEVSGSAAASWIQAIGSVIAIAAAIWIANRQHNQNVALVKAEQLRIEEQRLDEKREERRLLENEVATVLVSLEDLTSAPRVGTVNTKVLEKATRDAAQARDHLRLIVAALDNNVGTALGGRKLTSVLNSIAGSNNWNVTPMAESIAMLAESWTNEIHAALDNIGPLAQK